MSMYASYPDGAFLVDRGGGAGSTRKEARSARFVAPTRALRVSAGSPNDLATRCRALQLVLPEGAAFVGVTAAHLYGIPVPPWMPDSDRPDIAVVEPADRPKREAIRSHQWRPDPTGYWVVDGVRVVSAARAWFDLAAILPPDYLVAAGDHVLRHGLASQDDLRIVVGWARRRRGVPIARDLVEFLTPRAESPPESRVRYWLAFHGLPTPKVNEIIVVGGDFLGKGDLVFEEPMVVLEYDGIVHLPEEQRRKDQTRRNRLQSAGWYVIVLTAEDLKDPYKMCRMIRSAVEPRTIIDPTHIGQRPFDSANTLR